MDEPLSNLDAKLRVQTRTQIAALQRRLGVTTVYVTHDQVEAMTMGDRVAVLKDGLLQQCDTPRVMYESPRNVFVAGFIGSPAMNIMEAQVANGIATVGDTQLPIPRTTADAVAKEGTGSATLGFRPESLDVVSQGSSGAFAVDVNVVEELGSDAFIYGTLASRHSDGITGGNDIIARVNPRDTPRKGDVVYLNVRENGFHAFSTKTGLRLPD
jgi:multiple sugar transport system ATP-binding protein